MSKMYPAMGTSNPPDLERKKWVMGGFIQPFFLHSSPLDVAKVIMYSTLYRFDHLWICVGRTCKYVNKSEKYM